MKLRIGQILLLACLFILFNCHDSVTPTHTVTYDGNGSTGGTVPVDSKGYASGASVTILANTGSLVKSGNVFSNWNSKADGSGTSYTPGAAFSMSTANTTLYANWTPSGSAWTSGTLPSSVAWQSVAFGNNTFVAVAVNSNVSAASTDGGRTWAAGTLPVSSSWSCVAYGAGVFVTLTDAAIGATSTDGINWTKKTIPGYAYLGLVYANNIFVAVGPNGSSSIVSSDGATWKTGVLPESAYWTSVAYGNNTFVAVAAGGKNAAASADGITWTAQTLPTSASWYSMAFGNGTFVAVDGNGKNAATSADGINWTLQALPVSGEWHVAFGNGAFVAVDLSSNNVATSTDGATWKSYQTLPSTTMWNAITYGNGNFVTISNKDNVVAIGN